MRSVLPIDVPPYFWTIRAMLSCPGRESQRAERDSRVGPAEAEGVGQRGADRHAACRVGNEIEIAARILVEQVCRGRRYLVPQRKHGKDRLDGRRSAEQMTRHRLGRRHGEFGRVLTEAALD